MGDGEPRNLKKSEETNKPKVPDFMKIDTIEKLRKQREQDIHDQAKYVSEYRVPNAQDILKSVDYSQQTLYSQRYQMPDTLRRIYKALKQGKALETSVQGMQLYDKYQHRITALEPSSISEQEPTLWQVVACLREQEWEKLRQEGVADKVEIVSDPLLHTDPFGFALSYGEEMIPNHDQQTIESRLREKYRRVSSALPGDRIVLYSRSEKAYITAGLIEDCDPVTREPTKIRYLAQKGGCTLRSSPSDLPKTASDDIEV